jgi:amidohydrolase
MIEAKSPEQVSMVEALTAFRRDLHRHPELGFEEVRTQARVREQLEALGYAPKVCAKTGLVADVRPDLMGSRPTIALRADIDCLPMEETTDLPHRSIHPGRAHKCGHDGHCAILVGVAKMLASVRDSLPGNVRLIFQPAEEGVDGGGAQVMVAQGALEGVDEVYGLHNWPGYPIGEVRVCAGPIMAGVCDFDIHVQGQGGHASQPQSCKDPVLAAAQVITTVHAAISREMGSAGGGVVSICEVHGGEARNVIPERVTMRGTIRTFDNVLNSRLQARLVAICQGLTTSLGMRVEAELIPSYPVLVNDERCARTVTAAAEKIFGAGNVSARELPMAGGEDFAYFAAHRPSAYFFLGAGRPGEFTPGCHHPDFDFEDRLLWPGVALFMEIVRQRLGDF